MTVSRIVVLVFLAVVSLQRLLETFARRGTISGRQQMQWSFHAFFWLHVIIIAGALAEHFLLRTTLAWGWTAFGFVLYIGSVILRNIAIRALGRFWSLQIEIRQEHQLIREGIYRYLRHPAYSAITLEVLSIPLVVNAWWTMLFAAATYLPVLMLRLRQEEKALVEKFGEPYRVYQCEVGALIPRCLFLGCRSRSGSPHHS